MDLQWNNIGRWPRRTRLIVFILFSVLFSLLCYLILLRSTLLIQQRMQYKIKTLQSQITQQQNALAELQQQATSKTELNRMRLTAQALYIMPQQLYQWIDFLAHLAQQNNLTWLAAQPLQTIQANFYQELPLELRITGTYQNICLFVAHITNLSPLFLSASFSLAPSNQSVDATQLLLEIHLQAFALNKPTHDSEKFTAPEIKKITLELLHDPFSLALIQNSFAINHLKMLGSIITQQKHWALVQNGHELLHISVGQQLDKYTRVTAITAHSITFTQITHQKSEPHTWQIFLQEKIS
jgi:type IV pilus assembly protein PilO